MPAGICEHGVSLQGDILKLIQACTQSLSHYRGAINHFVSLAHYWIKQSYFNLPPILESTLTQQKPVSFGKYDQAFASVWTWL